MSLTSCPECEGQVSDAAVTCPHCGHPLQSIDSKQPTSPGWYRDPTGVATHEAYWDGEKWTGETRKPGGTTGEPSGSHRAKAWLITAGALMVVGSFLPWAQAGIFSFSGTQGDGVLTLVAGVIVGIGGFFRSTTMVPGVATIALAGLSLLVVGNVMSNFVDTPENMGTGLVVVGLGALIGVIGGLRALDDWRANRAKD